MQNYWLEPVVNLLTISFVCWLAALLVLRYSHHQSNKCGAVTSFSTEALGLAVATLCGYLYFFILNFWFAFTPEYNPVFAWILENKTQTPWFRPLVTAQDITQQLVLALPAAWLLLKIRPPHAVLYLVLFMLPAFLYHYSDLLINPKLLADWRLFIAGIIFSLTVFPIAYVALYKWQRYRAPSLRIE